MGDPGASALLNARPVSVLITGVNGFVGSAVRTRIDQNPRFSVRGTGRSPSARGLGDYHVQELAAGVDWQAVVAGIDTIVHCAARVHVMADSAVDPLAEFRAVNVAGTLDLASQAAQAGVRRFIFVSSVKVNGESTPPDRPFREDDSPSPEDSYGVSKHEAEQALRVLARSSGMEVVILRPPLVYGAGVKGNFSSLLRLAASGLPLPFASIHNRRSMIYLANLADLIVRCVDHPAAANQTFLVSDGQDISTSDLLRELRGNMGVSARLLPIPPAWLLLAGRITGRSALVHRLCASLQVDSSKVQQSLGWRPPFSVREGLQETVEAFLKKKA